MKKPLLGKYLVLAYSVQYKEDRSPYWSLRTCCVLQATADPLFSKVGKAHKLTDTHGDYMVQRMHFNRTECFNRNLSGLEILMRSFLPQRTIFLSVVYSFIQQILIPSRVPSHPFFSQEDQPQETDTACATNPKTGGRQRWHTPKNSSKCPPPPYPPPQTQTLRELGADSREKRKFLYSSQTSLKGKWLFWLTWEGGGGENTRWNVKFSRWKKIVSLP